MQLISCMEISMKASYKLILRFFDGDGQSFPQFPIQQVCNVFRDKADFLDADKHQSFLQVDFNTLGIKASYKVILSLLMDKIKHSQITQSNKFAISSQYLKKEVSIEFSYCIQISIETSTSWIFVFDESSQTCSKYAKKEVCKLFAKQQEKILKLLWCSIVMQNIQVLYGTPVTFDVTSFGQLWSKMGVVFQIMER